MAELTNATYGYNVLLKWLPIEIGCAPDEAEILKEGIIGYQTLANFIDDEVEAAVVARGGT